MRMKHIGIYLGFGALMLLGAFGYLLYQEANQEVENAGIADGTYIGFIHDVDLSGSRLAFDDADWLTGTEGEDAAIRAGVCTEETRRECLPNDYFIENKLASDRSMPVDNDVVVILETFSMEKTGQIAPDEMSIGAFAALIQSPTLHWKALPYRLTVSNHVVTRIEEIYIP